MRRSTAPRSTPRRLVARPFGVLAVVAGVVVALGVAPAPAAAASPRDAYLVTSSITVNLIDAPSAGPATQCVYSGSTAQVLTPADGAVQLGTGIPGVDYPGDAGPFRDTRGKPIPFACVRGISACFDPATASVSITGDAEIVLIATLYRGRTPFGWATRPCVNGKEDQAKVAVGAPGGCLGFGLSGRDAGATISLCASVQRIFGIP